MLDREQSKLNKKREDVLKAAVRTMSYVPMLQENE
jgi:hypothetical protein